MSAEAGFMPEVHALLAGRSAERLAGVRFVVLGHGVSGSFSGPSVWKTMPRPRMGEQDVCQVLGVAHVVGQNEVAPCVRGVRVPSGP